MTTNERFPCPECTGWVLKWQDEYYKCNSCFRKYSFQYIKGYIAGQHRVQKDVKYRIETLTRKNKHLSHRLYLSKGFNMPNRALISSSDVRRLIADDYRRSGVDKTNMPTPKQLDSEYLLWTGAKIKKDETVGIVKYYVIGYSPNGDDVINVIKWLHQI